MRRININYMELYADYLINRLGLLTETYKDTAIIKIFFEYKSEMVLLQMIENYYLPKNIMLIHTIIII